MCMSCHLCNYMLPDCQCLGVRLIEEPPEQKVCRSLIWQFSDHGSIISVSARKHTCERTEEQDEPERTKVLIDTKHS